MKSIIFNIKGMSCVVCSASCQRALLKLDGVSRADVNFASGKAVVEYDESKVDVAALAQAVQKTATSCSRLCASSWDSHCCFGRCCR